MRKISLAILNNSIFQTETGPERSLFSTQVDATKVIGSTTAQNNE